MFSVIMSWLLMIPALCVFIIASCINDVLMKLLVSIGKERIARHCMLQFSRLNNLILRLWGTQIKFKSSAINLDPERPILFVSSHHSSLDITLLYSYLNELTGNRKLAFISRSGLDRWIPSVSFYARQYGYTLIRRSTSTPTYKTSAGANQLPMARYANRIDSQGDALILFPEGVKHYKNKVEHNSAFHRNGLRILLENMPNVQIVPIAVAGTGAFYMSPRSLKDLPHNYPRFNCCIHIEVLPVLQEFQLDDIENVIDILEERIHAGFDKLQSTATTRRNFFMNWKYKWTP